jgi:ankyrin repeat protein
MILDSPFEFPYGTPLHWASAARNFAAMQVLLRSGAAIDAPCFNNHPHSTALSLAVHFGDVKLVSFLISMGANPHVMDPKQRTLLHRLSYRLPELHGSHPHQWHYWIRHGPWEEHKKRMSEMVELLLRAGLSLEAYSNTIPPLTPVLTAAGSDLNNGGAINALVSAGADINNARGTCQDSVLISWSGIAQEKLFYPDCYSEVMKLIINRTRDLGHANEQGETALHIVAATDSSQEQFRSNVFALLSQNRPTDINAIDINARDRYGNTPLLLSLMGEANAMYQAAILLDGGADTHVVNDRGENVFGVITANKFFMDEISAAHIMTLLLRANALTQVSFKKFESSSKEALLNASVFARPKTLQLLLDLGMSTHINEIRGRDEEKSVLDLALDSAEGSREAYMNKCVNYGKTFSTKQVEDSGWLYDDRQGGPERARRSPHLDIF